MIEIHDRDRRFDDRPPGPPRTAPSSRASGERCVARPDSEARPIRSLVRIALLLTLALVVTLPACSSLSKEEQAAFDVYMRNGQQYYDSGRYQQAEQQVRKALALDSSDFKARLLLGWSLLQQGTPETLREARAEFESLVRRDSSDFRVHQGLGTARYKIALGRDQQADVLEKRGDVELAARARKEYGEGLAAAQKSFERVLELNEDYPEALSNLGQVKLLRGEPEEALVLFERFLELAVKTRRYLEGQKRERMLTTADLEVLDGKISRNIDREVTVRDLVANVHYDQDRPEASVEQLDRILALRPLEYDTYLQRAHCYAKMGRYTDAADDVEAFLRKTNRGVEDPLVLRANRLLEEYLTKR